MHRLNVIKAHLNCQRPVQTTNSHVCNENSSWLYVDPEVQDALDNNKPIVALESTIISHGMPYPQNYETAREVEQVARKNGAIPATIAILDGVVHVGLSDESLKKLAVLGMKARKCSRRDLAVVLAEKGNGATTVAATMYIANLVGIRVFVTGGVGGVHRGVEQTMDISADLTELGRTPVAVICAGVKSILDIPRTLENLETQGVSVVGYGVEEFPAFFTRKSGCKAPLTLHSATQCAKLIDANRSLRMTSGMVIGVPIPLEQEAKASVIQKAQDKALGELSEKGIQGRDVTPYLLARINELTQGHSLTSNIALVKNNCKVGSQIAVELSKLSSSAGPSLPTGNQNHSPVVVGGTNYDIIAVPSPGVKLEIHTSNPGQYTSNWGGVGRNIAEVLARLQTYPFLVTSVGKDTTGRAFFKHCRSLGIRSENVIVSDLPTSSYIAVHDEKGDLAVSVAAMDSANDTVPGKIPSSVLSSSPFVVCDANVPTSTIDYVSEVCYKSGVPVWFEPVSKVKSLKGLNAFRKGHLTFISPSVHELAALARSSGWVPPQQFDEDKPTDSDIKSVCVALFSTVNSTQNTAIWIVVTRGEEGVLLAGWTPSLGPATTANTHFIHLPTTPIRTSPNTNGAGDTLVGGAVWGLLQYNRKSGNLYPTTDEVVAAVKMGMLAARETVCSPLTVSHTITPDTLRQAEHKL